MANPHKNYEQDKIKGEVKQTVIIDEAETGETDELDPKYHEDESPDLVPADPGNDIQDKAAAIEGIEVDKTALSQTDAGSNDVDADLNHNADDDLSLNKAENDLF